MKKQCRVPFEARVDVFEGRADRKMNELVSRHLADNCATCSHDMAWLKAYVPAVNGALRYDEQRVSAAAFARASSIMLEPETESGIARLVTAARLLFDSRNRNTVFAPARDSADGSVHVVYRTDNADVDLWQEEQRKGDWYVTGQALSLDGIDMAPPTAATLQFATEEPRVATIENAEFCFESVSSGKYLLSLLWDDLEIQVGDLAVGSAEAP